MLIFLCYVVVRLNDELPPLVEAPPVVVVPAGSSSSRSTHGSIETLLVVLAVITIVGVIAGIIARICGGRHFGGSGEHDIEGWVEKKCRSCIDAGLPPPPPPPPPATPPPAKESKPTTTEEAKK
ncbi:hypothetical protein BVC80_8385g5 [Macleaya cordata]|uniref:Uncharacterized protein n=1 Tax=Macleaya cordata TaxID=56857 RepID=A0A200Q3R2_MACCD|nr:hypothetical protein BVC80_8385g5 [Macleaya cordata]